MRRFAAVQARNRNLRTEPLKLPVAVAEHRHAPAGARQTSYVELRRADHEIDVDAAVVDARQVALVDGEREAVAERDVARGVLVEQGVVEDRAERTDTALAVDERDLAQARRTQVRLRLRPDRGAVLVRLDLDRPSLLEADAKAAYDRAVTQNERL